MRKSRKTNQADAVAQGRNDDRLPRKAVAKNMGSDLMLIDCDGVANQACLWMVFR